MKKIYIGILAMSVFACFNVHAKTVNYINPEKDYLSDNDEFQAIENFSYKTIIGREAGTVNNVDKNVFDGAHRVLSGIDSIDETYLIVEKLEYDSKLLYPKEEREDPITADDIIKVNKEYDLKNKNSTLKLKSFSDIFSSNTSSNKATAKKDPIKKAAPSVDSFTAGNGKMETQNGFTSQDIAKISNTKLESYNLDSSIISHIGKYEQKEMLKELTKKGLFGRNV